MFMRVQLIRERDQRMQAEAALQEHGAAIEEMQEELQHSRCEGLTGWCGKRTSGAPVPLGPGRLYWRILFHSISLYRPITQSTVAGGPSLKPPRKPVYSLCIRMVVMQA